jgi:hypothetical protein
MITSYRTANVAPGKFPSAMKFAHEAAAYIKQKTGEENRIAVPIGGNPFRIGWSAEHENLAALDAYLMKLAGDQKYIEMLVKNADNFIGGSVHDQIWRAI